MSDPVERLLWDAAKNGRASEVSSLLRDHREIDVNWTTNPQSTPLHKASFNGHVEVVKLLLANPNIEVNLKCGNGQTPFSLGVSFVEVLLKDSRVDVTLHDNKGRTPLWSASYYGQHEVIE